MTKKNLLDDEYYVITATMTRGFFQQGEAVFTSNMWEGALNGDKYRDWDMQKNITEEW